MLSRATISFVKNLNDKKHRQENGLFVAEGLKLVREICSSDFTVRDVYALQEVTDAVFLHERVTTVSAKEMERISQLKNPSNILAVVEIPNYDFSLEVAEHNLVIALDSLQDPGNLGTIIRLADWFGISDILCSKDSVDCFNPKAVQATMGAITRVRVHYVDLPQVLGRCNKRGIPVYGTAMDGENVYETELSGNGIVVMGNEGHGVSGQVLRLVDKRLAIPSYALGDAVPESLNVAIATAVLCAEFRRRRT